MKLNNYKNFLFLALSGILASISFAQTTVAPINKSDIRRESEIESKITIDALSLGFKGLGVNYEYVFLDKVTAGLNLGFINIDEEFPKNILAQDERDVYRLGIRSNYYLNSYDTSSFYGFLGLENVRTTYKARFQNSIRGDTARDTQTDITLGAGYQLRVNSLKSTNPLLVKGGVLYGPGYNLATQARRLSDGATAARITSQSDLFYELGLSVVF
jgi:opacity protein-like surface antigen